MKHFLSLTCLLAVFFTSIKAQGYEPYLVSEGKQWATYYEQSWNTGQSIVSMTFRLQGDTIVGGKKYLKQLISFEKDLSDMQFMHVCLREENGKVYTLEGMNENLWFDYTAQVGDTICFKEGLDYGLVKSIDVVVIDNSDGKPRKCYKVQIGTTASSSQELYFTDSYIYVYEHIGVLNSPDYGYGLSGHCLLSCYGVTHTLLCVHDNDVALYQSPEGCYKESTIDVEPITCKTSSPYYDLMGRKVANPTRGIYIKDGKKVMIE